MLGIAQHIDHAQPRTRWQFVQEMLATFDNGFLGAQPTLQRLTGRVLRD